jgi:hypothetical protein
MDNGSEEGGAHPTEKHEPPMRSWAAAGIGPMWVTASRSAHNGTDQLTPLLANAGLGAVVQEWPLVETSPLL